VWIGGVSGWIGRGIAARGIGMAKVFLLQLNFCFFIGLLKAALLFTGMEKTDCKIPLQAINILIMLLFVL